MISKILKWLLKLIWKLFLLFLYAVVRLAELILQGIGQLISKGIH